MSTTNPDSEGYYHIGTHRLRFEPPDILHLITNGIVEPHHFDEFFTLALRLVPDRPVYVLRDASRGGELGRKTRARIIELAQPSRVGGIVSYGASFHLRVVVTMLLKAIRAFKQSTPDVVFVETEPDARAWIDAQRAKHPQSISPETKSETNHR